MRLFQRERRYFVFLLAPIFAVMLCGCPFLEEWLDGWCNPPEQGYRVVGLVWDSERGSQSSSGRIGAAIVSAQGLGIRAVTADRGQFELTLPVAGERIFDVLAHGFRAKSQLVAVNTDRETVLAFQLRRFEIFEGHGYEPPWVYWVSRPYGIASWQVIPEQPTTEDVLQFSGPTDGFVNPCYASREMGYPTLEIDPGNRTVELFFQLPGPEGCVDSAEGASGLEGQFGPLEAGEWRFFSEEPMLDFSIDFEVVAE